MKHEGLVFDFIFVLLKEWYHFNCMQFGGDRE